MTKALARIAFGCLIAVVALRGQSGPPVHVGIVGDQTGTRDLDAAYAALERGVKLLTNSRVSVILHTGDLVESSLAVEEYSKRFDQAVSILGGSGKPWHLAPGDHDVNPPGFQPNSQDRSRQQLFYDLYRKHERALTSGLTHSFDVNGYHFIALNTHDQLHVDPRWGDVFLARLSFDQQKWLKSDLERHRKAKGIVVFLHQPLWYNWVGWMPIHSMLREYPVIAVIAGHFHYDQDDGFLDRIRYVVVGATGGNVKQSNRDGGNIQHVTVMTLRGREAEFRLIPLDGSTNLRLTPRQDMDRLQAIDQLLGELYRFSEQNKICLANGKLQTVAGEPARLALIPIGNPVDVPVQLAVDLNNDKFQLEQATFAKEECVEVRPEGVCVLAPGSRIESSNTSSVVLNDRFAPLAPLWNSGVAIRPGAQVSPGDVLTVTVRLAFDGIQGRHSISATPTTAITECPTK